MEKIILTNPKDEKYDTVTITVELGSPYIVTVYDIGSYKCVIGAVTGTSIVVTDVEPIDNAKQETFYSIHGSKGKRAIFPTSDIYDIERV